MKKQIKKLSLNKKTISNLHSSEMSRLIGGIASGWWCSHSCNGHCGGGGNTKNGATCPGRNTCDGQNTCYC